MAFGLVVLMAALTYDASVKSDPHHLVLAHERLRERRDRLRRQGQQAGSVARWAVWAAVETLRTLGMKFALEWWPRFSQRARRSPSLSLESTTGQVIVGLAVSVIAAYLLMVFG